MYKSERFWDRLAKNYDRQDSDSGAKHIRTIQKIKEYINKNDIVFDYGCATGTIAIDIADNVKKIHGIDISSKMIQAAEKKAENRKIYNVEFAHTSIYDDNYKPESFDVVIAFNILHLLEDYEKVIRRISELLKPGGIFISSSACLAQEKAIIGKFLSFLSKIKLVPHVKLFNIKELENSIVEGNFQIVEKEKNFQGKFSYLVIAKK